MFTTAKIKQSLDGGSFAAILTALLVYGVSIYIYQTKEFESEPSIPIITLGFIVYLLAFVAAVAQTATYRIRILSASVMLISAFGLLYLMHFEFLSILTIIWVAVIATFLSIRSVIVLSAVVIVSWFVLASWLVDRALWIQGMLYSTFHIFALLLSTSNRREKIMNDELRQKNDHLLATQDLLTQFSRQSERTRIARELHDLVGHQITALVIKLQVASRLTTGEAKKQVDECHHVSKQLLADVRSAVASIRDSQPINLESSLRLLVQNTPSLKVSITMQDGLSIEDSQVALTLFRCIQEATTNSLKHSGASQITISIREQEQQINTLIFDDGKIGTSWSEGNGLKGMRERVKLLKGSLELYRNNNALNYRIILPRIGMGQ